MLLSPQWLKLEEAYEQERHLTHAITQRGGLLGLLLHRTICHDEDNVKKDVETQREEDTDIAVS